MEKQKLDRINELARKAKTVPLSEAEKLEQKQLREEYIQAYRESLHAQLDRIVLIEPDGKKTPLKKK